MCTEAFIVWMGEAFIVWVKGCAQKHLSYKWEWHLLPVKGCAMCTKAFIVWMGEAFIVWVK
jgi:hypothetical protein